MFNCINTDECSGAAQAGLTVYRDAAFLLLNGIQKLFNNFFARCRAIDVIEVEVLDSGIYKLLSVVLVAIQPNDERDAKLLKYRYVVFRRECSVLVMLRHRPFSSRHAEMKKPIVYSV